MKHRIILLIALTLTGAGRGFCQLPELTAKEKSEGWVLLFDSTSSDGWKKFSGEPFPSTGWKISNDVLSVDPSQGRGGDIVTEVRFSDFELSLEFMVTRGANSGIKYFEFENTNLGLEFQILDDENHPDAKNGRDGNHLQGSLYDLIPPGKTGVSRPVGEWNHTRIVSNGNRVEHWLNGEKIVSYKRGGKAFEKLVSESKYKGREGFGMIDRSPVLLQDHGDVVSFRNIKIRHL